MNTQSALTCHINGALVFINEVLQAPEMKTLGNATPALGLKINAIKSHLEEAASLVRENERRTRRLLAAKEMRQSNF